MRECRRLGQDGGDEAFSACDMLGHRHGKEASDMHYESDYVLRLIEQMGGLVRQAVERLRVGNEAETYELADEAISLALDMDPHVVHRLSPQSLVALLELNNLDDRIIQLVADALMLQAGALEQSGEIVESSVRRDQSRAVLAMLDPARAN